MKYKYLVSLEEIGIPLLICDIQWRRDIYSILHKVLSNVRRRWMKHLKGVSLLKAEKLSRSLTVKSHTEKDGRNGTMTSWKRERIGRVEREELKTMKLNWFPLRIHSFYTRFQLCGRRLTLLNPFGISEKTKLEGWTLEEKQRIMRIQCHRWAWIPRCEAHFRNGETRKSNLQELWNLALQRNPKLFIVYLVLWYYKLKEMSWNKIVWFVFSPDSFYVHNSIISE